MKSFKLLIALLLCSAIAFGQDTREKVEKYIDSLNRATTIDSGLMTYPGLNILMAKKVNAHLTGSGDLSLNKSYFIVDPADGRLFLGINKAKDPSEGSSRTKFIHTIGIRTNVADAFSTLYTGDKRKPESGIGASYKLTWLGRGIIRYNRNKIQQQLKSLADSVTIARRNYTKVEIGEYYRQQVKNRIVAKIDEEEQEFNSSLSGIEALWAKKQKNEFDAAQVKKFRKEYITAEAENVESNQLYSAFHNHWVSIELYIPFTPQARVNVANALNSPVRNNGLYDVQMSISYNRIFESEKLRLLGTVGTGVKHEDNLSDDLKKYTAAEYKAQGGTDTVNIAEHDIETIYTGNYDQFFTPVFKLQLVGFFFLQKKTGLSFLAEQTGGKRNSLDLKLGIPFVLKGKDEDTKASFELQGKWTDFRNTLFPDKTRADKFVLGLSVGIPLSSKTY